MEIKNISLRTPPQNPISGRFIINFKIEIDSRDVDQKGGGIKEWHMQDITLASFCRGAHVHPRYCGEKACAQVLGYLEKYVYH